jgi:hypothetical protein
LASAREADGSISARNGTGFFLRTPEALFGVTAAHVVEGPGGWRESCALRGKAPLRLGAKNGASVELPWDARCIDIDLDIDIATFMISPLEIEAIERVSALGGVVVAGPNPSVDCGESIPGFELFQARRADFIRSDRSLDRELWEARCHP